MSQHSNTHVGNISNKRKRPAKAIKKIALSAIAAPALILGLGNVASATDYVVTSTADTAGTTTGITLRDAIIAANTNTASGLAPAGEADGDTITISVPVTLTSSLPAIIEDLAITGTPTGTISGDGQFQIFTVDAGAEIVSFTDVVLTEGSAPDGGALHVMAGSTAVSATNLTVTDSQAVGGTAATQGGGAIFNAGTLMLTMPTLTGNTAVDGSLSGGAINNASTGVLTITGGEISGNTANRAGGGIENTGTITISGVTLDNNVVNTSPGNGGGFHTGGTGTLDMTGGTVSGNTAGSEGGGLWNSGAGSNMTITDTVIDNNTASGAGADEGGGGIFNGGAMGNGGDLILTNVTITNNTADGTSGSGGGILNFGGEVEIEGGEISGNSASRAGGGIETANGTATANVEMVNVVLDNNNTGDAPGNGGGLHMSQVSNVDITGGTINGNTAAAEGGGVWNGGGASTMTITDTIISGNTASGTAAAQGGGGVFNGGAAGDGGTLTLNNVTLTNNSADGVLAEGATGQSGNGGAILNFGGSLIIQGGTISSNESVRAGGGIEVTNGSNTIITGAVISNNTTGPMPGNGGGLHVSGIATVTVEDDTLFDANTAASEGGGLWNGDGDSVMTITDSAIINNIANGEAADNGGGGLFNGGAAGNGGTMNLEDVVITGNMALGTAGSGGGILNFGGILNITRGVINNNEASRAGGGIEDNSNSAGGTTTVNISEVTIDSNTVGATPGNGAGIHIGGDGTTTISLSTISNNTAAKEGGGLWNSTSGTLNVENSTVSGNTANGAETGGGGVFTQGGETNLTNVTVANNTANIGGGVQDSEMSSNGGITANNSIIADNNAATGPNFSGPLVASDSVVELSGTISSGFSASNSSFADPQLAGLANNGGATQTHAIADTSPAVDRLATANCNITADQRDAPRNDAGCDAGAYELVDQAIGTATDNSNADAVTVAVGAMDVSALAFSLANNSGETITVSGFSGSVVSKGNFADEILVAEVYLDVNGNGEQDTGDMLVGTADVRPNTGIFVVDFGATPQDIADGDTVSYVIALDFADSDMEVMMLAAGGLALFAVPFLFVGWRRRIGASIALATAVLLLSACGDSANNNNDNDARSVQFKLENVDAASADGTPALFPALPIDGPVITPEG